MIELLYRCGQGHTGEGKYTVADNWFLDSKEMPQIYCIHCGKACIVRRV